MSDTWRYVCPKGHVSVHRKADHGGRMTEYTHWYCQNCYEAYDTVIDQKTGRKVRP